MLTNDIATVAPWAYNILEDECGRPTAAIGCVVDGRVVWGCVFEGFTGASIIVHFAFKKTKTIE